MSEMPDCREVAFPLVASRGQCPADRNFGKPCIYPRAREIAYSCGSECCTAGICNVQAGSAAPYVHFPTDGKVALIFFRLAFLQNALSGKHASS